MFNFNHKFAAQAVKVALVLAVGAQLAGAAGLKGQTHESVAQQLHKGVTTKDQVRQLYGEPTAVETVNSGEEEWTYSRTETPAAGLAYIPFVGDLMANTNSSYTSLKVKFNRSGRVSSYSMRKDKMD